MLNNLIQGYLLENNLTGENVIDYNYKYNEEQGYYIDKWNFEIPKPIFTQEIINAENLVYSKEKIILNLKHNNEKRILNEYSLIKQLDIIGRINGYTEIDFTNMNTFITSKIDEYRIIKENINSCETIEELELININLT